LTTVVVALIAAGRTVGAITQDVYGHDEPALVDPAVSSWFAAHHTTIADTVSEAILAPVRWPWLVATIVAMTAAIGVWRGGRDGGRVLAGGVGAWAIVVALQQLLPTPASGAPFPATEPAVVAVLSVTLADVVGRSHGWAAGARATAVASMLVTDPSTWKPRHGAPFRYEPPRV
jgi:hypothetical protein